MGSGGASSGMGTAGTGSSTSGSTMGSGHLGSGNNGGTSSLSSSSGSSAGSSGLTGSSLTGDERRSGGPSSPNLPRLEDALHGSDTHMSRDSRRQTSGYGDQQSRGSQDGQHGLLGQQGGEWAERVRSTVREHPLAAVAGALVLGTMLSRRRH